MELSELMKTRRRQLGITQLDLAEMAEVGIATVKDIERGVANPSMATVNKLLDILGVEIVYQIRKVNE